MRWELVLVGPLITASASTEALVATGVIGRAVVCDAGSGERSDIDGWGVLVLLVLLLLLPLRVLLLLLLLVVMVRGRRAHGRGMLRKNLTLPKYWLGTLEKPHR